ncbi:MAG: hypothetical protein M1834_004778 [Cirrosporium novae-zelandiae]|nr:MAG: hypothetical protein M1834_004778 [Cirrosporium novae-zelandiae]
MAFPPHASQHPPNYLNGDGNTISLFLTMAENLRMKCQSFCIHHIAHLMDRTCIPDRSSDFFRNERTELLAEMDNIATFAQSNDNNSNNNNPHWGSWAQDLFEMCHRIQGCRYDIEMLGNVDLPIQEQYYKRQILVLKVQILAFEIALYRGLFLDHRTRFVDEEETLEDEEAEELEARGWDFRSAGVSPEGSEIYYGDVQEE